MAYCGHAEMIALDEAQPGDTILVQRWRADGSLAMAKPCRYCQVRLRRAGVRVKYSDENGIIRRLM